LKILLASETYSPNINGAAVFTRRLAQALLRIGHDVAVVAPSMRHEDEVQIDQGVTIYRMRSLPILVHPDYRLPLPDGDQILEVVSSFRPDIVHIQNHFAIGQAVLRAARKFVLPIVGTNHFMPEGMLHYLVPHLVENLVKPLAWWRCIATLNKLDYVTAPTGAAIRLLIAHGLKVPGRVVSNGVDVKTFYPGHDSSKLKERLSLPEKPTVLYTGRLEREKNMDILVKAIPHVLTQVDAHFIIGGRGKEEKPLRRLAEALGVADQVTFAGFLPEEELPALYNTAQVFAIASPVELQSIVALEAAASGLPIVAARALALPELVLDGENGFLFPPGDPEAMGKSIAQILRDAELGRVMGMKSRCLAEGHAMSLTVDRFVAVYEQAQKLHERQMASLSLPPID